MPRGWRATLPSGGFSLEQMTGTTLRRVEAIAASAAFRDATDRPRLLAQAQRDAGFDFLILTPTPIPGAPPPGQGGLAVLAPETLARLSPGLARSGRGLVVVASVPVAETGGLLAGGILLNGNNDFIDRISDLVYPSGADQGIITLFLDDIRIATTLRPDGAARATGTRASAEVTAQVLGEGRPWHDTAFVVNGWYISAYEALTDSTGNRIGMLYAGIPQAPYTAARRVTFLMIGGAFVLLGGIFIPFALAAVRGIFRPVEAMGATIRRVEGGDMSARTGPVSGARELAHLSDHLDRLLARLDTRERELRALNADLNARVEARTADLTRANQVLEVTSRQLILSEKLATIGEVTAGVAHEINNPLAVISGNLEVVRMVLAERAPEAETELRLIDEQIVRISRLVTQLLQFARPEEFTESTGADVTDAIAGLRPLVQQMLARSDVRLVEDLSAQTRIRMNLHEFQQVLINLIANAVQAMPGGGEIRLTATEQTSDTGQAGVLITLRDTGPGIDAETLPHVFDAFFTTRGTEGGTGLGLPICLNLVTRQGGTLTVTSDIGQGTCFRIWLPSP
ncbi:sensor histidine kinase [Paenirhodobacter sp.]|uniref:sensor histidine kinase n=1 Tax=Paenirhodobacter sp. TaxID=1965326 RepID=UPI003B3E76DB